MRQDPGNSLGTGLMATYEQPPKIAGCEPQCSTPCVSDQRCSSHVARALHGAGPTVRLRRSEPWSTVASASRGAIRGANESLARCAQHGIRLAHQDQLTHLDLEIFVARRVSGAVRDRTMRNIQASNVDISTAARHTPVPCRDGDDVGAVASDKGYVVARELVTQTVRAGGMVDCRASERHGAALPRRLRPGAPGPGRRSSISVLVSAGMSGHQYDMERYDELPEVAQEARP